MPAQSQYFTSIVSTFASYLQLQQVPPEIREESTLLLLEYLKNKKNFDTWNTRELEFFLENNREAAKFAADPKLHLTQFVRRYPPYQTSVMLHQYQLALVDDGCSQSTIKNYRSDINQFLQFSNETLLNRAFLKPKVVEFVRYQRQKGLKRASVRRKLVSLSQFAFWAEKQGMIEEPLGWLSELAEKVEEVDEWAVEGASQAHTAAPQAEKIVPLPPAAAPMLRSAPANPRKSTAGIAQSHQEFRTRLKQHLSALSNRVDSGRKQQLLPIVNTAMFVLFILGGGFFGYQQFIKNANAPFAYPNALTRPNRTLSFQGRLTDSAKNPVVSATNARFKLYDSGPSVSGGTILWDSGTCVLDPDQDGIFSTGLGDDCGSEIGEEVFSENSNVWLQVEIDNGSSYEVLEPRQSIKTVPYALNSETLQGFPASMSATENTVLVMDENGDVNLGSLNPDLRSTSGTFTIEAEALVLQTASGSNGDIVLAPDGSGQVTALSDLSVFGDLTSTGYLSAPGATLSATYAGGTALVTRGGPSGTVNIQEWQDSSGTALSVVDESGNFGIGTSNPSSALEVNGTITLSDGDNTTPTIISSGNNDIGFFTNGTNTSGLIGGSAGQNYLQVAGAGVVSNVIYFNASGTSNAPAYTFDGDSDTGIFRASNNIIGFSTAGAEQMRINATGDVGIGTSPSYKLDVSGDINLTGALRAGGDAGTSGYLLTSSGGSGMTWTDPSTFAGSDDQTLAEVLTEGNTTGGTNIVFSTTDELRFYDDDADQRIYASADGTLNIESANLAINTSSWDISTGGAATGFTSLTASGTIQGGNLTDGTAALSSGTLDLGTNTISDSNFNGNWAFNSGNLSGIGTLSMSGQLTNSVTTGTAPFSIASTTLVTNLNADLLDGLSSADFCQANGTNCSASAGGWTDDGTVVRLTTATDQVGIGTANPSSRLHVHTNSGQSGITISTNTNVGSGNATVLTFESDSDGSTNPATIGQYGDGSLRMSGSGSLVSPDMVITDAGNVGIGTDSPGYLLDVSGVGQLENLRLTDLVAGGANTSVLALDGSNNVDLLDISGYDTNGSDDLTTSTSFSGDVSGLYNDLQLGSGVVGSTEIADGAILEIDLSATNSPTDDYILSYDQGSGGFTWVSAGTSTDDQTLAEVLAQGYTTGGSNMVFTTTDEIRFYDDDADSRIYSSADGTLNLNSTNIAIDTSTWDISTAGAVSGLTTLSMSGQLTSSVTTGTAPFSIASTTLVTNLNADLLDGQHASDFMAASTDDWIDEIGDTITGSLNFSGVASDITTTGNEHLALMPGGTGNVGIGLTTPGYKLDVSGDINLSGALRAGGDAGTSGYVLTSGGGGAMTWTDPSALTTNWWDNTDNLLHPIGEYAGVADLAIGGNSTASANIHLQSSGQAYFAGNVGIGDNAPGSILSVLSAGNVATNFAITNNVSGTPQTIVNYKYNTSSNLGRMSALNVDSTASLYLYSTATRGLGLGAGSSATPHLYINPSGQVGISSTTPSYGLDVGGTGRFTGAVALDTVSTVSDNNFVLTRNTSTNVLEKIDTTNWDKDSSDDVAGSGTENYLAKWDTTGLTDSIVFDDGTMVGIGTNTPASKLSVTNDGDAASGEPLLYLHQYEDEDIIQGWYNSNNDPQFRISYTGSIYAPEFISSSNNLYYLNPTASTSLKIQGRAGIGTTNPSHMLSISGGASAFNINLGDISGETGISLHADNATQQRADLRRYSDRLSLVTSSSSSAPGDTNGLHILNNGNVGVGSTSPSYLLDIDGTLRATDTVNFSGLVAGGTNTSVLALDGSNNVDLIDISGYDTDGSDDVGGSGTQNYLAKWGATGQALTDSVIYDNGANVGIGITNPSVKLHVNGQDSIFGSSTSGHSAVINIDTGPGLHEPILRFRTDGTNRWEIFTYGTTNANAGKFGITNGTNRSSPPFVIDTSQNIGIGTHSPGDKLHVDGKIRLPDAKGVAFQFGGGIGVADGLSIRATTNPSGSSTLFGVESSGAAVRFGVTQDTGTFARDGFWAGGYTSGTLTRNVGIIDSGSDMQLYAGGSEQMRITSSGNVGIGTTSSSSRLQIGSNTVTQQWVGSDPYVLIQGVDNETAVTALKIADENLVEMFSVSTYANGGSNGGRAYFGGDVGIGTTAPNYKLQVNGDAYIDSTNLYLNGITSSAQNGLRLHYAGTSSYIDHRGSGSLNFRADNSNGGSTRMTLTSAGDLGVGTTSPSEKLHVSGNIRTTGSIEMPNNWQIVYSTEGSNGLAIQNNGGSDVLRAESNRIAVMFPAADGSDSACYVSGTGKLGRCTSLSRYKDNQQTLSMGINTLMSLRPVEYDWNIGAKKHDLGFIAEEVEAVNPLLADYNISGTLSGVKYRHMTALIVKGIQEQQLQIQNNTSALQNLGSLSITDSGQVALTGSNGNYQVTVQGSASNKLLVSAQAIIGRIQSGLINTRELVVSQAASINNLSVNSLSINGQSLQNYIAGIVLQMSGSQSATGSGELVSPVAELDGLEVSGESKLAGLLVSDTATFSGQLTAGAIETDSLESETSKLGSLLADSATVSGTLTAETIEAATISAHSSRLALLESRLAEFEHVKATTAELVDATVSGTLYAENIIFKNKIASAENKPSILEVTKEKIVEPESGENEDSENLQPLYDSIANSGYQASSSADLDLKLTDLNLSADDVTLTAQATFIDNYFRVNGTAYIADSLGIGSQLLVGQGTQIADGTFSYTAPAGTEQILHIQPHGQGTLSLMAGLMTLTEDGNVTINGSLNVAGNLKVEDTLLTNLIQPAEFGNPFQVQVAGVNADSEEVQESRFEIINELGSPVATISAQGRADFAAGIGIGSEELSAPSEGSDNEVDSSKSSGRATLPANSEEITIKSSLISENSLIYVTPVGSTQNQVLYVKSQSEGEKFVVGFDEAIDESVNFNWWIVN